MIKEKKIHRDSETISNIMAEMNRQFMQYKYVRLERYDGHWMTIHEHLNTRPIEYALHLDDNRVIWVHYNELDKFIRDALWDIDNKLYDEDDRELLAYDYF